MDGQTSASLDRGEELAREFAPLAMQTPPGDAHGRQADGDECGVAGAVGFGGLPVGVVAAAVEFDDQARRRPQAVDDQRGRPGRRRARSSSAAARRSRPGTPRSASRAPALRRPRLSTSASTERSRRLPRHPGSARAARQRGRVSHAADSAMAIIWRTRAGDSVAAASRIVRATVVIGMPSWTVRSSAGSVRRWKMSPGRERRSVGTAT